MLALVARASCWLVSFCPPIAMVVRAWFDLGTVFSDGAKKHLKKRTPFFIFCTEKRGEVREAHPDMAITEQVLLARSRPMTTPSNDAVTECKLDLAGPGAWAHVGRAYGTREGEIPAAR